MAPAKNHLIEGLRRQDRQRLHELCEPVELTFNQVLYEGQRSIPYVYFPIEGYVSMLTLLDGKPVLEVSMIGSEGMLGAHVALGIDTTPFQALVQGQGTALRLKTAAFRAALDESAELRPRVYRYLYVQMAQMASSSACMRFHLIEQRLARWLLMTHDRARSDHFAITQEFLAFMLGVRRVGVTGAASELQRRGIIEYRRGAMSVVDRKGLETAACACYAINQRTYRSMLGTVTPHGS